MTTDGLRAKLRYRAFRLVHGTEGTVRDMQRAGHPHTRIGGCDRCKEKYRELLVAEGIDPEDRGGRLAAGGVVARRLGETAEQLEKRRRFGERMPPVGRAELGLALGWGSTLA